MKKSIALVLALVLAACCAVFFKRCSGLEETDQSLTKCCSGLYQIAAPVEPDYQAAEKLLASSPVLRESIGSAMVTGSFAGYSFDYTKEIDSYIVQTKAAEGRYAILGVAVLDSAQNPEAQAEGSAEGVNLAALSALLTDGINDQGLFACLLRMNDVNAAVSEGTNPVSPDKFNFLLSVRYLLERAASAQEAVSLLQGLNLYTTAEEEGCAYHLLVADKEESFAVELIDNTLVVTEGWKELTNYCISRPISTLARGTERFNYLHEISEYVSSRWGMMKTIWAVRGSQIYAAENKWYSDFYGMYTDAEGNQVELNSGTEHADADALIAPLLEKYQQDPAGFWMNIHSSVYDFETGTLSIRNNEKALELKFSLNIEHAEPVSEEESDETFESTEITESAEITENTESTESTEETAQ